MKSVAVSKGYDFTNVREDVAVVDPEGHRSKCSEREREKEREKKTREFANSEEFGKMLIMTNVASRTRIFTIVSPYLVLVRWCPIVWVVYRVFPGGDV